MGDQKNLILAIVLSVAIIFIFQILFPVQTPTITSSENIDEIQPAASIDDTQIITKNVIIIFILILFWFFNKINVSIMK